MEAVWILGSFLIHWLLDFIKQTTQRINPHYQINIVGRSGGKWRNLRQLIQSFNGKKPKFIIIHLGGNDIGTLPIGTLIHNIKTDLTSLSRQYDSTRLVWSDILPRRYWSEARGKKAQAKGIRRK